MELRFLFMKNLQEKKVFRLERVDSKRNPADLMTKALSRRRIDEIMDLMVPY